MKTHPDFKIKKSNINEICPRCKEICNYGFKEIDTPEYCDKCGYDLRRPINQVKKFFHNIFWGPDKWKYPLAHCRKGYLEIKNLEQLYKSSKRKQK